MVYCNLLTFLDLNISESNKKGIYKTISPVYVSSSLSQKQNRHHTVGTPQEMDDMLMNASCSTLDYLNKTFIPSKSKYIIPNRFKKR